MIGAPKAGVEGIDLNGLYDSRGSRKAEDKVKSSFIGGSSYLSSFADYGSLPKANIKAQKKFTAGFGEFDGLSSYNISFNNAGAESLYSKALEEKKRVKEYGRKQVKGGLAPDKPHPFKGESRARYDYGSSKNTKPVEKVVPFDLVRKSDQRWPVSVCNSNWRYLKFIFRTKSCKSSWSVAVAHYVFTCVLCIVVCAARRFEDERAVREPQAVRHEGVQRAHWLIQREAVKL